MIVTYKEAGWEVVTQRSHGLLAAQFTAQWQWKTPHSRWTELVFAIAEHDDAENELDGENLLTPAGGPLNFDMKNFELPHCQKLASLTITKSRYIALLTSMHMAFLYRKDEADIPEAKAFLDEQRQLQATWRKDLGLSKEEVEKDYALMEWCDALSLLICQGQMQPESRRLEISTGPDGKLYSLTQLDEESLTVQPWPFINPSFSIQFEKRLIPQISFKSSAQFRQAFLAAGVEEKVWQVRKVKQPKSRSKKKV
jgi:hypothetical protein